MGLKNMKELNFASPNWVYLLKSVKNWLCEPESIKRWLKTVFPEFKILIDLD
jgi:hypothetical protein